MLILRESPADAGAIRAITAAAFAGPAHPGPGDQPAGPVSPPPTAPASTPDRTVPEAWLVDELRAGSAWIPALSLVAIGPGHEVIGHVLCTRGQVGPAPVLALGPLTVRPDHQRRGVGSALMHTVLGAADALGEPLVALLGDPGYYQRFGFRAGAGYQIVPPEPSWHPHFQVRTLSSYPPSLCGEFTYPEPYRRLP